MGPATRVLRAALCVLTLTGTAQVACGREEEAGRADRPSTPREGAGLEASSLVARRAEVARRGPAVMPFDLARTTHAFHARGYGGIQTVVARDPLDSEQVRLVREHLQVEAARFATGDFSDPALLHGDRMPGLAELREAAGRLRVRYEDVPGGGRIRYSSSDPELVRALHRWFAAQTSDHAEHARP